MANLQRQLDFYNKWTNLYRVGLVYYTVNTVTHPSIAQFLYRNKNSDGNRAIVKHQVCYNGKISICGIYKV